MPWGSQDFILGHKTALGDVQIVNTSFVHEQDHYILSLKDINSHCHWVKVTKTKNLVTKTKNLPW
jgi:hypothetical protein